jgi:hypothetical protein
MWSNRFFVVACSLLISAAFWISPGRIVTPLPADHTPFASETVSGALHICPQLLYLLRQQSFFASVHYCFEPATSEVRKLLTRSTEIPVSTPAWVHQSL